MRSRLEDKNKALELRKNGLSYGEIREIIPVSKGVLSGWFKDLNLSANEILVLKQKSEERQHKGRLRASLINTQKRIIKEERVFMYAEDKFNLLKEDSMFLLGIALYWAEGSKRTGEFQFINSDPDMILFMYKWIQKYLDIDKKIIKARLFTHKVEDFENHLPFWADILSIKTSEFQKTIATVTLQLYAKRVMEILIITALSLTMLNRN